MKKTFDPEEFETLVSNIYAALKAGGIKPGWVSAAAVIAAGVAWMKLNGAQERNVVDLTATLYNAGDATANVAN